MKRSVLIAELFAGPAIIYTHPLATQGNPLAGDVRFAMMDGGAAFIQPGMQAQYAAWQAPAWWCYVEGLGKLDAQFHEFGLYSAKYPATGRSGMQGCAQVGAGDLPYIGEATLSRWGTRQAACGNHLRQPGPVVAVARAQQVRRLQYCSLDTASLGGGQDAGFSLGFGVRVMDGAV